MLKIWTEDAWSDYLFWQKQDRKTLRRINQLIRDIERDPVDGLGKPEALRFDMQGLWSRRIDSQNRLVYSVSGEKLYIYSCRDHYKK